MPELGQALSALLDDPGSPDQAAMAIASDGALVAQARIALPALQHAAMAKAGPDGVRKVIAKRFETYPQPQRTDEQWAAWWADYLETLADVSLASLEAGMRAYVAEPSSEFMPKPGRLRELAFTAPCRNMQRYYRAKRALQMADEPKPLAITDAEATKRAEEVRALARDFLAKPLDAPAKPTLPSIAGPVDDGGLTPMMRESMARRDAERTRP